MNISPAGGSNHHHNYYTLEFQVWRPSPAVNDRSGSGCYSIVGANRFTSVSVKSNLAVVSPSPEDYIPFRPGDVLGFYVEAVSSALSNGIAPGVVVLTSPSSFTSEVVWHASMAVPPTRATSHNPGEHCPYSVGNKGVLNTLTHAAPVVSISTGE